MDIQLQGELDGLSTAEMIHDQFGTPVVFVTANVNDEAIRRAKRAGSYGFLNKPFRPAELKATIEIALAQHQASIAQSAEREALKEQVHVTSTELGQTKEDLRALSQHLMKAQEEEQSRIARELHDDLGQQAALLGMQADLLLQESTAEQRARCLALRAGLRTLSQGLRDVAHRLHPSIISDLGLTDALESLINEFVARGLSVSKSLAAIEDVSLDVSTALYRIAQECLQNAYKHAPASQVRVLLTGSSGEVKLQVSDNGPGFSFSDVKGRGGLGFISMQERARLIDGNLELIAGQGLGTTVNVVVVSS